MKKIQCLLVLISNQQLFILKISCYRIYYQWQWEEGGSDFYSFHCIFQICYQKNHFFFHLFITYLASLGLNYGLWDLVP